MRDGFFSALLADGRPTRRPRCLRLPRADRSGESGFALVLVLSLVAILVVAAYAISLIGKVDGELAATDTYHLQARQHALLGLRLGLAELQRAAGDSSAVTAPANIRRTSNTTPAYPALAGVWAAGHVAASPSHWFVSGNFGAPGSAQISPDSLPAESATTITLLGSGTVTAARDMARARRVAIPAAHGGYAFWIGDEGAKAALAHAPTDAPLAPNGSPLIIDPRRDMPTFAYDSPVRGQPFFWGDLRRLVGAINMKSRFRSYTAKAHWVAGGALVGGRFNVNTSNPISWEAILRAYETARAADQPALGAADAQRLGERIAANIGPKQSLGKPRLGPFFSVAAFWDSGLVQDSLDDAGITDLAQADLQAILWPLLAVRSDTFLIRAYGDAHSPADAGDESAESALPPPPRATAYCEAIVQRTPRPAPLAGGLRFEVISFRWLASEEI